MRTPAESGLPCPVPVVESDTEAYWRAAAEGCLLLSQCTHCDAFVWVPRVVCPHDLAPTRWVPASGLGVVYSHTVVHRGEGAYAKIAPFVLAYVELDEGPRVMTNIVGCPPDHVRIGQQVRVVFDQADDVGIPRFTPVRGPA